MTGAIMIFLMLAAGLFQSLIPAIAWMGLSKPPILLAVALYYALVHSRGMALIVAILAGIVQDSMSLFPVGYSSLCFVAFALVVGGARETLFKDSLFTVAMVGGVLSALTPLLLYFMLKMSSFDVSLPAGWVALKMGGGALLGVVTAPVVWWLASGLEHHVGATVADER